MGKFRAKDQQSTDEQPVKCMQHQHKIESTQPIRPIFCIITEKHGDIVISLG